MSQREQIREERAKGELLGSLIETYGADAVVQALGVHAIAHILGLDENIPDYTEGDAFDDWEMSR